MQRWVVVLVLALAVAPCAARADEASKRAKVEELVSVMHMDRMMNQMLEAIKGQTEQAMQQPGADSMTPEQKKIETDYQAKALQIVIDSMGWKAMEPEFVTLYAQNFTEEEIDGMVTFYKSPTGQAVLNKMPQLMSSAMQLAQSRMVDIQPKMKALMEDRAKQMAAATPKSSSPAAKN
jgi:hypothetical protein